MFEYFISADWLSKSEEDSRGAQSFIRLSGQTGFNCEYAEAQKLYDEDGTEYSGTLFYDDIPNLDGATLRPIVPDHYDIKVTVGENGDFKLDISVGVCIYPDHGKSFDELEFKARQALSKAMESESDMLYYYDNKKSGGGKQ